MSLAWEDIRGPASKMFNIWTSGGDLDFAEQAWQFLQAAGLVSGDDIVSKTKSCMVLLALCRIYLAFCEAKWDESADIPISFLAEDLDIDPVALGLLASGEMSKYVQDLYFEAFELRENALVAVTKLLEPQVLECLRTAFGGSTGLYLRLSRTRANDDEQDGNEFEVTGPNMDAYDFLNHGFIR